MCWPTSTAPAPPTDLPRRSMDDWNTCAARPSGSATSPTTSHDRSSRPADSDPTYTLDPDEPLSGSGWAEQDDVLLGCDEVESAEVGDGFAFEAAGVVVVEVLQRLAGREAGGADASLSAVGFAGGDLALQAGGEEFLVGPVLLPCP